MDLTNYFKELFESMTVFRKVVLLALLFQDNKNLLKEIVLKNKKFNQISLEFLNNLLEQHEEYLEYVKNEDESVIEKFLNK